MESGLVKVVEVDHAIFLTLMSNGSLTHNKLYRKTQEFAKCHSKNFDVNLKQLVHDNLVLRKKKGKQQIEYSLNHDISKSIKDTIQWLENIIEESEDAYHNIKESAKMLAEAKKINQKYYKKSLSILDRSAKIIVLLLEATKWYPLLIKLGGMPKIVVNKLIRMQKVHLETIDRIFNLIPTLDPEIYANILSLIVKKMDPNPSLDVPKSS